MTRICLISFSLMAVLLAGCSGLKTYSSDLDDNLRIMTETDSGSVFSSINAAVDIHQVKPDCSTEYAGTVQLDDSSIDVGIPTGRSSYLVFVFESSGFFQGDSSITYNTLIRPRAGYRYNAKVSYKDDIYNVILNEVDPGSNKSRELDAREMSACRPV